MRSIKIFMALVTVCLVAICTGKQQAVAATTGIANGHEWVDLGLPSGLKWATCNVGAYSPEGYGNYYAWGETTTKSEYTGDNSKTWGKNLGDISGNARYDAARANWGGSWRMPTRAEFDELLNHCAWQWTTQSGVKGYKVTGKNGNSIFLPAAGWRYGSSRDGAGELGTYWGSTPYEVRAYNAYGLNFGSGYYGTDWFDRGSGRTVRPVCDGNGESEMTATTTTATLQQAEPPTVSGTINGKDYVDLGLPSGLKWATCNVGASSSEQYGNYYAWGETNTKSEYTEDNSKTYGKNFGDISGDARYDAARANWGGSWRMPTRAEYEELRNHCVWQWTTQNGVNGYKVTGKNGNSIFLPAAGFCSLSSQNDAGELGYYWSSTPDEDGTDSAYYLYFRSGRHTTGWGSRDGGLTVRPVSD